MDLREMLGYATQVSTIIEALCMYGYIDITPAYDETTLKLKYLSDETAMGMIDLVRDNVVLDFAMIYSSSLSQMYSYISNSVHSNIAGITSGIKAQSKIWQKTLEKFYADYEKIGQSYPPKFIQHIFYFNT